MQDFYFNSIPLLDHQNKKVHANSAVYSGELAWEVITTKKMRRLVTMGWDGMTASCRVVLRFEEFRV